MAGTCASTADAGAVDTRSAEAAYASKTNIVLPHDVKANQLTLMKARLTAVTGKSGAGLVAGEYPYTP